MMPAPGRKPAARTLATGFFARAAETPEAIAFTVAGRATTYGDAADGALRMAHGLAEALGRRPLRVGVLASKSRAAYEGVLASLAAGAGFVPLHPAFPVERTREMARQSRLDAIIADAAGARRLEELLPGLSPSPVVIIPEAADAAALRGMGPRVLCRRELAASPCPTRPAVSAEDLAYLMFTSGSTGRPKGVPVTHAAAMAAIDATLARVPLTPRDRVSQGIEPTFDLSVAEMFMAWESGARCCAMATNELLAPARAIAREGLTAWVSTPSLVAHLRSRGLLARSSLPTLRWTLFCGEPLPQASALAWKMAAPGARIENLYGPTEATIWCFARRFDPTEPASAQVNGIVPIGRPLPGTTCAVVDASLRMTDGEGELCLAGAQVFDGYWDDGEATARAFLTARGEDGRVQRWYRTGDRVRVLPSGELAHLGRMDTQVKVQGHRLELGEVEQALRAILPATAEVAVLPWPLRDGSAEGLVAFIAGAGAEARAMLQALRGTLPAWAVPSRIEVLEAMPRNASGKLDRGALRTRLERGVAA
jgi:amino acid adenylation domain-containing protein